MDFSLFPFSLTLSNGSLVSPSISVHPLRGSAVDIHPNACWKQNGITVAGRKENGYGTDQLNNPWGLFVDDEQTIYVADPNNHRIMEWKRDVTNGQVVAGGNGQGRTVVAGGNGSGNRLDQLDEPTYVFVDRDHSVYVSDWNNHRVMKWSKDATQGIVMAGGQGRGNGHTQLSYPRGFVVDQLGIVYVADAGNDRIMRWPKGVTQGSVIIGGNGQGKESNQLNWPFGLSFDRHGNLYVVDRYNHRVQKFNIASNA
ncbi:unnamed protein product [Rotaria sordida]|uniref:Uncharacterized protein n=1 Tax=Rotaria sordida TaxID=392033 RepID=A0A816G521_9BILA|nr:unnamed protein product [Rotaria sordida]CAF1669364.1 unnamed protein product [Rotaria sordida]